MKVYLLDDSDFTRLLSEIDRDPRWGSQGGSSTVLSDLEQKAHDKAHRWFNYAVRTWIDSVQRGDSAK